MSPLTFLCGRRTIYVAVLILTTFRGTAHFLCVHSDGVTGSSRESLIDDDSPVLVTDCPPGNSSLDDTTTSPSSTNITVDQWVDVEGRTTQNPQSWRHAYNYANFYLRGVYFAIVTVLGLIGNIITVVVLRRSALHSSSSVYLMGLATSDILFLVVFAPTACKPFSSVVVLNSYKTFYAYYVSYVFPLVNTFHTSGNWIMICFTVERFIAVTYPMKAQTICTTSRARIAVVLAFAFGVVLNSTRFLRRTVYEVTDPNTNETYMSYKLASLALNQTYETIFFWVYTAATKLIPFPLLIFLNCSVIGRVWQARNRRLGMTGKKGTAEDEEKSREKQITRLLIAIVFAFLICNLTAGWASLYVAIEGMAKIYTATNALVFYMFLFAEVLVNSNPLVNVIMYTTCSSTMRKSIKDLLCPKFSFIRKPSMARSFGTAETEVKEWSLYRIGNAR